LKKLVVAIAQPACTRMMNSDVAAGIAVIQRLHI
jgi:hypothetical protein